ncbi:hypothetical protein TELCIR_09057 [Teladorsagia circumcincta]|uniref:[phosphatase 2A protein]-leucine-carboxy methyltransferase n=1 Tax=Teladorsagia circumcincta TaxID=45464 RepID=A0A2G9UFW9_TELCI|nr:hypothetical protein TELCIR_09057 [Teladorsagia circumcincta]
MKKFVDVDFSSVTAKKIRQIRKPGSPDLVSLFNEPPKETQHTDLHCGDYHLVGADLRQWGEFKSKLDSVGIDTTLPTFFIAEIEKIEHLDEMELLRQLLDHYCIGYAVNDKSEKFTSRLVFPEL